MLNGEKIFVTSGDRADLIVVWATLDRKVGRAAIKSFIVERDNPGLKLDRLEHKLGIRASDTANFTLQNCRVPKEALLGDPEINTKQGFGGAMQTFDNTRPLVAAMAVGVARASLEETRKRLEEAGVEIDYDTPALSQSAAAARYLEMESDYEASHLLTLQAAWMADNGKPNSLQASMAKAKAGRTCVDVALGCVELCGSVGYGENELLEKWARDAKILDIFEGTQQIQLLIVARQLLGQELERTAVGGRAGAPLPERAAVAAALECFGRGAPDLLAHAAQSPSAASPSQPAYTRAETDSMKRSQADCRA